MFVLSVERSLFGKTKDYIPSITYTMRNPTTVKSSISSSYLSFSSGFGGARSARTQLSRPEPGDAGSTRAGCISDTTRVAPTGNTSDGAIFSGKFSETTAQLCEELTPT